MDGSDSTILPYSRKNPRELGRTTQLARNGSVSAPAVVTIMLSFRLCRMAKLNDAPKKIQPSGSTLSHSERGGASSCAASSVSFGTLGNERDRHHFFL